MPYHSERNPIVPSCLVSLPQVVRLPAPCTERRLIQSLKDAGLVTEEEDLTKKDWYKVTRKGVKNYFQLMDVMRQVEHTCSTSFCGASNGRTGLFAAGMGAKVRSLRCRRACAHPYHTWLVEARRVQEGTQPAPRHVGSPACVGLMPCLSLMRPT